MYQKEIEAMIKAAREAEKIIMEIYATDFAVEIKSDDSPVTAADKGADAIIREVLGKAFPTYGFLTEESRDTKKRLSKRDVFIVDPVDGTKEFVNRNGEFCTNIALAHDHEIVAGVINVPAKNTLYYASKGEGAYRIDPDGSIHKIHVSDRKDNLRCVMSRSFLLPEEVALLNKHNDKITKSWSAGAAVKYCTIAQGDAEISFRMSQGTKEWDTAAGDILLQEAGGMMVKMDGTRYTYNREDVYNRDPYELLNSMDNFLK